MKLNKKELDGQHPCHYFVYANVFILTLILTSFHKKITWAGGEVSGLWLNSSEVSVVINLYAGGITETLLQEKSNLTSFSLLSSETRQKVIYYN